MERGNLTYYLREGELPPNIAEAAVAAATAVLRAFMIAPEVAQWCARCREKEAGFAEMPVAAADDDGGISARMLEALEFGAQAWDIACQAADEVADVFGFGLGELTNYPDDAEKARAERAA